ncbi:L-rhamnose mutarotase [Bacillus dakarensis]|uniref:L-rhamnose mutarotase n=1 Tax=Robertmurraya dakarensis TaxID=1926278 RepID=UPI00098111C4|nr:L-rhamnose mutarotase [Bacillus dakarensis]SLL31577.1 Uncharacterised protein [Mycobacteroides abscessus subsp. abscessus]
MENSLIMKTDTSFALNFLIYIQNIFLNQNRNEEDLRFPYLSTRIAFKEDFELKYDELWNEISQRISEDNKNDLKIFYEENNLFFQWLFVNDEDSLMNFNEIYETFKVWWNSFAGRFAIERSVDEMGQKLYWDLANSLVQRGIEPKKEVNISLIYDECLLANAQVSSYFAVLPIGNFFVKYKELVQKLKMYILN